MIEPPETEAPPNDPNKPPTEPKSLSENRGVIKAASVLAIGNIASRILGLLRDTTITHYFGANLASAYEVATLIPNNLFDAIKTGLVDSALVPTFSDLANRENRDALWGAVSVFLSVISVILLLAVIFLEIFYEQAGFLIGVQNLEDPTLAPISLELMRLALPAVLFLSISSGLTALLYSLKRFTIPAFLPAIFNGCIVMVALIRPNHVSSLVYGLLLGSILQIAIQIPALRDAKLRWNFDLKHPVLRRILRLFAPIVGVLLVDQIVRLVSYNLAIRTGDGSLNYMRRATTLLQFPMGLVVTALTVAILPVLSQQASRIGEYKETLAGGIRLVMVLIMPAAAGLFAIALPLVDLLFGHGEYTAFDVDQTAAALQVYLFGLPFAAVDQMLIFDSYARKDTFTPSLVGVISLMVNVTVAILFISTLGLFSLMVADGAKHMVHTAIMVFFLYRTIGGLGGYNILVTAIKAIVAGITTGVVAYFVAMFLRSNLPYTSLFEIITVASAALSGVGVYMILVFLFDIREAKELLRRFSRR